MALADAAAQFAQGQAASGGALQATREPLNRPLLYTISVWDFLALTLVRGLGAGLAVRVDWVLRRGSVLLAGLSTAVALCRGAGAAG